MPRRRLLSAIACVALIGGLVSAHPIQEPPPGMAVYVVGFLKKGAAEKTADHAKLMSEHLAHLRALVIAGDAVAVGPFADDGELRGIVIFRDMPVEQARKLEEADPLAKAGLVTIELHPWWGPANIGRGYAERAKATPLEQLPFAQFQFGLLTRGPKWTPAETPEIAELQKAHMAHIEDMAKSGKLIAAGPFTDGGTLRGLFLFQSTPDEARALAAADPMVKIGRLVVDIHPWMTTEGVIPVNGK